MRDLAGSAPKAEAVSHITMDPYPILFNSSVSLSTSQPNSSAPIKVIASDTATPIAIPAGMDMARPVAF
jgi:hypothetical protein